MLARPRPLAIAALVTVAALAAGCGPFGGGDDPLTRDEFIAKGNEICQKGRDQFAELSPPRTPSQAADFTGRLIAITEREISELRALDAPDQSQDALDRYLGAREDGLAILREGQSAAEEADAAAYARAQAEVAQGQVKRAKLARAAGFTECSGPLGGSAAG